MGERLGARIRAPRNVSGAVAFGGLSWSWCCPAPWIKCIRGMGRYGISAVRVWPSLRLDAGKLDHLGPFFSFGHDEVPKFGT
jgi:hypothetical protein